jgi:hypothetical protein
MELMFRMPPLWSNFNLETFVGGVIVATYRGDRHCHGSSEVVRDASEPIERVPDLLQYLGFSELEAHDCFDVRFLNFD